MQMDREHSLQSSCLLVAGIAYKFDNSEPRKVGRKALRKG